MSRAPSGFAFAVVGLVALVSACATPLRESPWLVAETPHFEIYSTLSSEGTSELAISLERFRALVMTVTNIGRTEGGDGGARTRSFAFSSLSEYSTFGPPDTAGFLLPRIRRDVMVVANSSPLSDISEVILHEYAHQILRGGSSRIPPLWYDEGIAELFSTARAGEEMFELGAVPKARIAPLLDDRWLPIDQILSVRSYAALTGDQLRMFYAQSWLLVHYLTFDRPQGLIRVGSEMEAYLKRVAAGQNVADAFKSSFGLSTLDVEHDMRELLKAGRFNRFGYPLAKLDRERVDPNLRTPTRSEVATRLGELRVVLGDGVMAEREFRAALATDETNSRAHAGMGDALEFQGRHEEAESHYLRAVELDESDPENLLDLAEFYELRALERATSPAALVSALERARTLHVRALRLDATLAEAWMVLGRTYLAPGEDHARALAYLSRSLELRPSATETLELIAESFLARGDELEARKFLEAGLAARSEGWVATSVDRALDEMRKARAERADRVGISSTSDPGTSDPN